MTNSLIRSNPFRDFYTIQRSLNHIFDELSTSGHDNMTYVPSAELTETVEAYHLKLEIPGMQVDDLDIQVTKKEVSISGERKEETQNKTNGIYRSEFRYGKFRRVIPLPAEVENSQTSATYKDGILMLTLPKAEDEKTKVVKVQVAG
jgi:HSP20 family protein